MQDPKVRLGIVGIGFGTYGILPAFKLVPQCEVRAICATSCDRAKDAASKLGVPFAFGDYREMLSSGEVDAVAIAVPPSVQPEIAMTAIERQLAVFAEKPLANDVVAARVLHDAASEANIPNVVNFIFPQTEVWQHAHRLIRSNSIGEVRHVVVQWTFESYDNRVGIKTWKTDSELGGGVLSHFVSHVFHYLEWFLGPIASLSSTLGRPTGYFTPGDTLVVLSVDFASGVSGSVTACNNALFGTGHRVEFYGDGGTVILQGGRKDHINDFRLFHAARGQEEPSEIRVHEEHPVPGHVDSRVAPLSRLANRFVGWIATGKPTNPTFEDGLRVQTLIDASRRSHESGTRIDV